ncbi:MAG TPA: hypothetical protein VGO47_03330, partial [Chlamydiales bacterium]|nr:hypothetical protein [Chlamydiales bacterium]
MEKDFLQTLASEPAASPAAQAGITYNTYLGSTWMAEPLWRSWSQAGRLLGSMRLNIPVDKIVTTTNYLEAFNGVLKQKFIGQLQKGGRWLRFDLLIFLLIKQILPSIFIQRQLESSYYQWLSEQFQAKTGRQNIKSWSVSHYTSPSKISHGSSPAFKYAWWHMESGADRQDEVSY